MTALYAVADSTHILAADVNQYRDMFRGNLVYDVKNGFGATGDGNTDDTAAINAALSTCGDYPGIVYFPPGTYIVSTLTVWDQTELVGSGIGVTTLKLKPNTNAAVIQTNNFSGLTGGATSGGPQSWAIRNMTIDGDKTNNATTGYGIRAYGYGYLIENVRVMNCKTAGIYSEWGTTSDFVSPHNMEATLINVQSHDNGGHGFDWRGPHDSVFIDCLSYLNATDGFNFSGAGNGCILIGCHSYGLDQVWAYNLGTTGNQLIGCTGEGAGTNSTTGGQVFVGANDNSITGGYYYSAGAHTNNVRGIVVGDGSHTNIASTVVSGARVVSCNSGGYCLNSEAGSFITGIVYQTSGAAISTTGSFSGETEYTLSVSGGATYTGHRTKSLGVYSGSNPKMGTGTLTAGQCQVYTSSITANSTIFLTPVTPGGTTGVLVAKNIGGTDRSAGNWFYVSSMTTAGAVQTADTSTFNWLLVEAQA